MHLDEKTLSSEQKFDGKIVKLYVDSPCSAIIACQTTTNRYYPTSTKEISSWAFCPAVRLTTLI